MAPRTGATPELLALSAKSIMETDADMLEYICHQAKTQTDEELASEFNNRGHQLFATLKQYAISYNIEKQMKVDCKYELFKLAIDSGYLLPITAFAQNALPHFNQMLDKNLDYFLNLELKEEDVKEIALDLTLLKQVARSATDVEVNTVFDAVNMLAVYAAIYFSKHNDFSKLC